MDLSYALPPELIAQVPLEKREESRLLFLHRSTGEIRHLVFRDIVNLLDCRTLLVLNNTKVFPARLFGRGEGGGKVEILLVKEKEPLVWEVIGRPGQRIRRGRVIYFDHRGFKAIVLEDRERKLLRFYSPRPLMDMFFKYGHTPIPPYIKRPSCEELDRNRYQTVYAKRIGSCACPTAGLHFTRSLLNVIRKKGVEIVEITLHIGPGTFRPVKDDKMEEEYFFISPETATIINSYKNRGMNIVAVGTSTVRALEQASTYGRVVPQEGNACIFIQPGYKFKIVTSLITNFHQPNSSPLALTAAFAGERILLKAYREAIEKRYRFLSYGDSMFIGP